MPELKTEALDDKVAENLAEVKVGTLLTLLFEINAEVLHTAEVEAKKFFDIQAQRLAAAKVEKLAWTLDEVNAKALYV